MERILIAYYSRSGNTEKVAKALADVTGGSLFRIETSQAYPADYRQLVVCAMDCRIWRVSRKCSFSAPTGSAPLFHLSGHSPRCRLFQADRSLLC